MSPLPWEKIPFCHNENNYSRQLVALLYYFGISNICAALRTAVKPCWNSWKMGQETWKIELTSKATTSKMPRLVLRRHSAYMS